MKKAKSKLIAVPQAVVANAWLGVKAADTMQLVQAIDSGFPFATLDACGRKAGCQWSS